MGHDSACVSSVAMIMCGVVFYKAILCGSGGVTALVLCLGLAAFSAAILYGGD